MDPHQHQLNTMDPKLKEAYEKVMNGPASAQKPSTPIAPIGNLHVPPAATPPPPGQHPKMVTEEQPDRTTEPLHTVAKTQENQSMVFTAKGHGSPGTFHIGHSATPGQKMVLEKKKLNIPPALYVVGCLLFFVLYTLFWLKVFGIPIPFLG